MRNKLPNPYESPAQAAQPIDSNRSKARWRLIPTMLIGAGGGAACALAALFVARTIEFLLIGDVGLGLRNGIHGSFFLAWGVSWTLASRWWWRRHWRRAVIATLCGPLLAFAVLIISVLVRH